MGNNIRGESGRLWVSGDKLDVLDASTVGNGDGGDDGAVRQLPQTEGVGPLNAKSGLQDAERDHEVRSQDDVVIPVNGETMGIELLPKNVEGALNIRHSRPLVDNVTCGISLDEATDSRAGGATHVCDEEAAFGLGADLIDDGAEKGAVAVGELGGVGVGGVEVVRRVLGLEDGEKTTTDKELAIGRGTEMVGLVTAGGDIGHGDDGAEGVLECEVRGCKPQRA